MDRTTTAESLNSRIEKSVPFIRYTGADNLIPYLNIRFALLNIETRYRTEHNTDDLEDEDIWHFYKNNIDCCCSSCDIPGAIERHRRGVHDYRDEHESSSSNDTDQDRDEMEIDEDTREVAATPVAVQVTGVTRDGQETLMITTVEHESTMDS